MKRKWIETGQELLIILLNHLVMISFGTTVMGLLKQDDRKVWLWSVLFIIPLLFYWARIKIRNFFLFFALHLAVPAGILFLPIQIVPKLLMLFISMVYFIWSIWIRVKEQRCSEGIVKPVLMMVVLGAMLLIETFYSQRGWEGIYIAMAILYVAGYCMYLFTSRYLRFLKVNESSTANIPEAEIFNNGFGQTFLYMAGVVTLLVLTANMKWFSNILLMLFKFLVSCIRNLLVRFFKNLFLGDNAIEEMPLEQISTEMETFSETGEQALSWLVMEKPIMIGVALFLVGLLVFGIVKGFQYLSKAFHRDSSKEKIKINNGMDSREACAIEKTKKEGSNWFSFLNHHEKIRKIYRKQVLKHKTAIIGDLDAEDLEYMTAKECCDKFAAEQLKKMYEKARYSAEKITSDDVRVAKSGVR